MDIEHAFPDLMIQLITSNSETKLLKQRLLGNGIPFKNAFLEAASGFSMYHKYTDFKTLVNIYKFG